MHRIRIVGLALTAAFALAGLSAGTASAKSLLLKEEGGGALAPGAEVGFFIEFTAAECVVEGFAFDGVNPAHKEILEKPFSISYCEDEEVPGGVQEVELTSSGNGTIIATSGSPIRLEPALEGCVYEFKKLAGFFTSPGPVLISGEAKGKLSKAFTTSKGCEKKLTTEFTAIVEADSEVTR
jgi:hypothetical protein